MCEGVDGGCLSLGGPADVVGVLHRHSPPKHVPSYPCRTSPVRLLPYGPQASLSWRCSSLTPWRRRTSWCWRGRRWWRWRQGGMGKGCNQGCNRLCNRRRNEESGRGDTGEGGGGGSGGKVRMVGMGARYCTLRSSGVVRGGGDGGRGARAGGGGGGDGTVGRGAALR